MADKAGMIRWFLEELPGLRIAGSLIRTLRKI